MKILAILLLTTVGCAGHITGTASSTKDTKQNAVGASDGGEDKPSDIITDIPIKQKDVVESIEEVTSDTIVSPQAGPAPAAPMPPAPIPVPTLPTTLDAPLNVTAIQSGATINITWSAVDNATFYEVYKSTTSDFTLVTPIFSPTTPAFADSAVAVGTTYYYRILAKNATLTSAVSAEVSKILVAVPGEPLYFAAATGQDAKVTLLWNIGNGSLATYRIYRDTTPGVVYTGTPHATVPAPATSFEDTDVTNGNIYYYRITAGNAAGDVAAYNEVDARPWSAASTADPSLVFVDPAAPAAGSGSPSAPFNTISSAITAVSAGGTVLLLDGAYSMTSPVSINKRLTLRSRTGHYIHSDAVITGAGIVSAVDAFVLTTGANGFRALGVEMTNFRTSPDTRGLFHSDTINDLTVENSYFYTVYAPAVGKTITTTTATGWKIIGNRVFNVLGDRDGFKPVNIGNCIIARNRIEQTNYYGINGSKIIDCDISRNTITNTVLGGITLDSTQEGNIVEYNTISNTNTAQSATYGGIRIKLGIVAGKSITIRYNKITGNHNGILINTGLDVSTITLTIAQNWLANNNLGTTGLGIKHIGTGTVTATNNYWGDPSGPFNATANPTGLGDSISDNVVITPFLTAPPPL